MNTKTDINTSLETLGMISDSVKIAESIFDDMISYESCEDMGLSLTLENMNLLKLIESVLQQMNLNAMKSGVLIEKSGIISDDIKISSTMKTSLLNNILFNGDKRRISQVIRTLVANAISRSPKGSTVSVSVNLVHKLTRKDLNDTNFYVSMKSSPPLEIFETTPSNLHSAYESQSRRMNSSPFFSPRIHVNRYLNMGDGCHLNIIENSSSVHSSSYSVMSTSNKISAHNETNGEAGDMIGDLIKRKIRQRKLTRKEFKFIVFEVHDSGPGVAKVGLNNKTFTFII